MLVDYFTNHYVLRSCRGRVVGTRAAIRRCLRVHTNAPYIVVLLLCANHVL